MSLTVETGAGVEGGNSYASLETALAYHADRGNAAWAAALDPARSAALIRASAAIDGLFGARFPGYRATSAQGLEWPRAEAWDRDGYPLVGLPQEVVNATCEAALIELGSAGALSKKAEPGLRSIKVGAIEKTFGPAGAAVAFPGIRQALGRVLRGGSGVPLSR